MRQAHLAAADPTGWAIDRIAELEERVAYLERELGLSIEATRVEALRLALGVTAYQARFLLVLLANSGRVMRPRQIVNALGSQGARIADASAIGRTVSNIRGRVGPGLFHCARGLGWAISPAGAARVSRALDETPCAVTPPPPRGRARSHELFLRAQEGVGGVNPRRRGRRDTSRPLQFREVNA